MMKKTTILSLVFFFAAFAMAGTALAKSKLNVAVSFNAMNEFVTAVAKDRVNVSVIIPEGTEPHEFSPQPGDLIAIKTADLLVYNGLGMEDQWLKKAVDAVGNKTLVLVEASKGANSIKNTDPEMIEEDGLYDPHLWLSVKGAMLETRNIKDALVKADPSNKAFFEQNYADFISKLEGLFDEYRQKFDAAPQKSFVTGHAAFAYFCRDFGLKQNSVEDVFASGEPSAKHMKELIDYCRENKIKVIFVEDMVSPKVSETLAREVGAKAQKIYTVESKEDGKDYLASIKANLEEIYQSVK